MADEKRRAKAKGKEGHPAVTPARETPERASGAFCARGESGGIRTRRRPCENATAAVRQAATQRPGRRKRPSRPVSPDQPPRRRSEGGGRRRPEATRGWGGPGRSRNTDEDRGARRKRTSRETTHLQGGQYAGRTGRVGSFSSEPELLTCTPSPESCTRRPHCPARRHALHSRYNPGSGRYTSDRFPPGTQSSATIS